MLAESATDAPPAPDALRAQVEQIRWFHTIDLGHGIVTPGQDESPRKLTQLRLPERFDGLSVLDIGAWDGFFSFEAERRGAERVVAIDPACWNGPAWGERGWGTRQGFDLAHRALRSKVQTRDIELLDLSPETIGTFDVVFFLGVLYHLEDPWPYLRAAASVCTKLMVVETHGDLLDTRRAAMAFYPGDELDGDPSNWWGPNRAALRGMLADAGFERIDLFVDAGRAKRIARSLARRARGGRYPIQAGRIVAHAWR
jgi:tRNA (mo5U34)-methyltransferase